MLTVLCVYWKGDKPFINRDYTEEWVLRLKANVERTLSIPYKFVCLTNQHIEGVDTIPLLHNWSGWWSKIELFRSDIPGDRFLYLDLDVIPLSDLDSLAKVKSPMVGLSINHIADKRDFRKSGRVQAISSGIMAWDYGYTHNIYDKFKEEYIDVYKGDQDWISVYLNSMKREFKTFPVQWTPMLRDITSKGDLKKYNKVLICSPNGWRMDIVEQYKGKQYSWVKDLWKGVNQ